MDDFYKNNDEFYSNIFSTNYLFSSTSTSPPTTPSATAAATDHAAVPGAGAGLYRARLILENHLYDELLNRYNLAVTRLHELGRETKALQEENVWLRLANVDLNRRLNRVFSITDEQPYVGPAASHSSTSVIDDEEEDEDDVEDERFSLPKSISRLKVRKEEKAIEMEVFNQGMYKTELCNKWQQTGTCPYGPHCQFAHGVSELRPIIRHPRYKTQVCRMVVAGVACPYGHRCHFRHSLS
ncbi:zinc finger CCCH domain-containing protein 14-like isoform X2 [Amaranthus tricolor]|uniref:zinc finger CCCH domain-containing protein 14-like isoform X2 n=1 Tax=Amaranthus tricolor TaxID=29722 RepID=UPI0025891A2F|nr:zinc finger CCCH domain-containing protein 14-like isoform X2 [Amaranthus tricolor]